MSSEPPAPVESDPPLPQDDFADHVLTAEFEPTADGSERALLYPEDRSGPELETRWIAARTGVLVDLEDVR